MKINENFFKLNNVPMSVCTDSIDTTEGKSPRIRVKYILAQLNPVYGYDTVERPKE